jgi:predicted hydrocarbon binding protein
MKSKFPIDGYDSPGPLTCGEPRFCVPRHQAVEAACGRDKYAETLYHASYKSARYWCDKEAGTHGLSGLAVLEQYLGRLSRRGWGSFSVIEADAASGTADIRLDYSAFVLAQAEVCAAKTCFTFAGWFAGMMDWISEDTGRPVKTLCCETQCGAEGHDHCVFAVRPQAAS